MDELWTLVLLSLAMLVGCYVAGIIPLAFTFSEDKLKLVTVLGAGLLVGTSLAVIIPEAVHTMYLSHPEAGDHGHHHHEDIRVSHAEGEKGKEGEEHIETVPAHVHARVDTHTAIGIALVVGFIFMLLIDQIGGNTHMHSHEPESLPQPLVKNRHKITATLGLVVHAAADGVALGAAIKTAEAHVTMIVFLAIMLHKAPAAFGLVSFLLHEGFDRPRIRRHLLIFAIAAPLLSLITYFGLSRQSKEMLSDFNTTGIAMLFSAGTFLYVATVHVLPEIANMGGPSWTTSPDGTVVVREQKQGFTKIELLAMVTGAVIPVVLSLGHSH